MDDLARRASVSNSTIRDFEAGRRMPIANNLTAIRRALEAEGIEFLFAADGSPTGIAGKTAAAVEERRPPADAARRRPGRRAAKIASPKRQSG
jgi:transcriptional regulator with XRE-family HTH domain